MAYSSTLKKRSLNCSFVDAAGKGKAKTYNQSYADCEEANMMEFFAAIDEITTLDVAEQGYTDKFIIEGSDSNM